MIILSFITTIYWRIEYYGTYLIQRNELTAWKRERKISEHSNLYAALEEKLEEIHSASNKKNSKKLYKEFTQLKKRLESMARYLAFLSLDVVDSTGMKNQEDKSLIQLDFIRFKRMVQKNLDANYCVKFAWTPDGVMACFNSVDNAVKAAQSSLIQLTNFNEHIKGISRDFEIRCGIHAGTIYFDEKLPLEEMTDQVIDIAGHMQKHAQPGTIAISKPSIKPLDSAGGFTKIEKKVDEFEVYQWTKIT